MIALLLADDAAAAAGGLVLLLVIATVLFFLYFLPTAVALSRAHPSAGGILALNLLLGWTLIGWAVSLAWALSSTQTAVTVVNNSPSLIPPSTPLVTSTKPCPHCLSDIAVAASVCRYCQRDVGARPSLPG